jgi:hypothetical protein
MKHLKWAPHMLTMEHKEQRVQSAKNILKTIAAAPRDSWNHFMPGDESWFYLSTNY